jgi:hypothetical protein
MTMTENFGVFRSLKFLVANLFGTSLEKLKAEDMENCANALKEIAGMNPDLTFIVIRPKHLGSALSGLLRSYVPELPWTSHIVRSGKECMSVIEAARGQNP